MVAFSIERVPLALEVSPRASFGGAIGVSPIMRNLFATLEPVAMSEATVLLEGETGAGKDVLARAIHASSSRAKGPFVVVDCGSIPSALVESELFGHEKGAFTGAQQARRGLFEEASSGTLFLDEVGELPLDMQPKLLRALEQREVRPVGGRTPRHVDVRVIAATNKRLAEAVRNKEFRQDLFYRLAVVRVNVPPLRDRSEDIVPLATSFLRAIKGDPSVVVAPDLAKLLTSYAWPGNVRELRNVIERYALAGAYTEGLLDDDGAAHLERGASADISKTPYHEARRANDDRFDREYLTRLLERTGGVMARAADEAGLARPSLYRMMDRLGVKRDEDG
jgi:transcriptional regulator with GAF, ATPase, and Fis domain